MGFRRAEDSEEGSAFVSEGGAIRRNSAIIWGVTGSVGISSSTGSWPESSAVPGAGVSVFEEEERGSSLDAEAGLSGEIPEGGGGVEGVGVGEEERGGPVVSSELISSAVAGVAEGTGVGVAEAFKVVEGGAEVEVAEADAEEGGVGVAAGAGVEAGLGVAEESAEAGGGGGVFTADAFTGVIGAVCSISSSSSSSTSASGPKISTSSVGGPESPTPPEEAPWGESPPTAWPQVSTFSVGWPRASTFSVGCSRASILSVDPAVGSPWVGESCCSGT